MKIVIIGAGAMGCLYGAYLSRHNEVIMLDSYQPQVDAINKNGITVSEEDGTEQHFSSVRACLSGEYKEDADLVIVFVKSTYTEDALKTNRKLLGEHTLVMKRSCASQRNRCNNYRQQSKRKQQSADYFKSA